jgi:TPR repeat protein
LRVKADLMPTREAPAAQCAWPQLPLALDQGICTSDQPRKALQISREREMWRSIATAVALLVLGALPASADDMSDCNNHEQLLRTDPARAVAACRVFADRGETWAENNLGYIYANASGNGVPQDLARAAKWYRKSAEQGDRYGQASLGYFYREGLGVPLDHVESVRWYRKAADRGLAAAQNVVGAAYATGDGVPRDAVQAYMWFSLAARAGDPDGAENRDRIGTEMTSSQIRQAQALVAAWRAIPAQ